MTKEQKRLVYTDSNGDLQVLGVLNAPQNDIPNYSGSATAVIQNIKVSRTLRGFNTCKVWATNQLFGNLPIKTSDFNGSEPEIFLEHYDTSTGNWVKEFRGYAENQGSIADDGNVAFKLYSFSKYTGKVNANKTAATTTNIVDSFQSLLPSGYQVEAPGDVTAPSVSQYTLVDKRRKGYRELAKDHGWTFRFTPETDGSGNYIVRFEPEGYGGTVGNIRGRQDYTDGDILAKKIKSWEKARTKDIINKVQVVGKDSNGNKVVGTATDSASVTDYGERFERFHIDYVLGGTTEADSIAQDKLSLSPGEGGEIKIDTYHESVINDSFDVKDSQRSIDGVYTCTEQQTFYPENNDKLVFTYETDAEKRAEKDDYLESERSKVYPSGQSTGSTNTNDADVVNSSGSDQPPVENFSGDDQPPVINNSGQQGSDVVNATSGAGGATKVEQAEQDGALVSSWNGGPEVVDTIFPNSTDTQGMFVTVNAYRSGASSATDTELFDIGFKIENTDTGEEYPGPNFEDTVRVNIMQGASGDPMTGTAAIFVPENTAADAFDLIIQGDVSLANSEDWIVNFTWYTIDEHSHGAGQLEADSHDHAAGTYDADSHDHDEGTYDAANHDHPDGTYNADNHDHGDVTVDTADEDKTDR